MKIEGTIKQLESILDHTRSMAAEADADEIWKEDIAALEFAITALRSMPEAGEPLSLEQLKQMDGKPVWIEDKEYPENTGWVIWDDSFKQNWLGDPETRNSHGKSWFAYSYPPAHIDRSEWTAEWIYPENEWNLPRCSKCGCNSKDATYGHKNNFCPKCGRAMTPEAWAELERRLKG